MSKVNFQVINNDILLELPTISKTTDAGILKPESVIKEEQSKADDFYLVINVGPECKYIKPGDRVYMSAGKHPKIILNDKIHVIVNEIHVLGKRIN